MCIKFCKSNSKVAGEIYERMHTANRDATATQAQGFFGGSVIFKVGQMPA
jgi:hypothetical protein